jgi:hypothetical protein
MNLIFFQLVKYIMPSYTVAFTPTLENLSLPANSALNPSNWVGNAHRHLKLKSDESDIVFTIAFPDSSTFTIGDDQKPLVYDYATNSFRLKVGIAWTPNHSTYAKIWHKCYDDSTYSIDGSNLLLTSTNQIDLYSSDYGVVASDENGQYKDTGIGDLIGWKFVKAYSGWARISNGVYMADPTSYTIGCVFSSDSTQLAPNKSPGSLWSVNASYGTDIRLFITNDGLGYNKITYRHNGVQVETTATDLLLNDTVYIIVVTYNGTTFNVYLNGVQVLSGSASSAGVGASDLLLGALTEGEGEYGGNYSWGGFIYDFAVFNTHDTDTRNQIEGYFAHTHSLTGLLSGSHPYKYTAPSI